MEAMSQLAGLRGDGLKIAQGPNGVRFLGESDAILELSEALRELS
jgi:hypothetical protein